MTKVEELVQQIHDKWCRCDRPPYLCNVSGAVVKAAVLAALELAAEVVEEYRYAFGKDILPAIRSLSIPSEKPREEP